MFLPLILAEISKKIARMIKHFSLIVVLLGCYMLWEQRPVWHGEGITVSEAPAINVLRSAKSIETDNYILTPVAAISGSSRLIGRKLYWFDDHASLSPIDFTLGWDKMSDEYYLRRMQVQIAEREHAIRFAIERIPKTNISDMVLHMHAIPSNDDIREKMRWMRRGHVIDFEGYIVDVLPKTEDASARRHKQKPSFKRNSSHFIWIENLTIQ